MIPGFGELLVSESGRSTIDQLFDGLTYRKVNLKKVVEIGWERWNWTREPEQWPNGPEPDDYIELGEHNPALPPRMETIWEVIAPCKIACIACDMSEAKFGTVWTVQLAEWDGSHLATTTWGQIPVVIVSEVGKDGLSTAFGKWVQFVEIGVAS